MQKLNAFNKILLFFLIGLNQNVLAQDFKIGDTIPNFTFNGLIGNKTKITDLRGGYVLITFWTSWNEESRNYNTMLIGTYIKFRDKKFNQGKRFNVVDISLDTDHKRYDLAMKKDNFAWYYHYVDFKGWQSDLVSHLKIFQVPGNILVDPNGVIIEKNLSIKQLEHLLQVY